jgi:predicted phosphoribosyltransferase
VVVVDDGVATGATARAAAQVLRARGAARVVLAAPVGPPDWDGAPDFDATIIDDRPFGFIAVGQHYVDFDEVPDADVVSILERHR